MSKLNNKDIADVLWSAYLLVVSRDGDVSTEGGDMATVDTDCIIGLEAKLVKLFNTNYDDITDKDAFKIRQKLMEFAK